MGQKVNPKIYRIGPLNSWDSKWFSKNNYADFLRLDFLIKKYIKNKLKEAAIAKIEIERSGNNMTVIIHTGKPGLIIGRGGQGVEDLKKEIKAKFLDKKMGLTINIQEVRDQSLSAELIVQSLIADIEKRIPYRRTMKQVIARVQKAGAQGVKVMCSGRLNGVEIARRESLGWGKLPLHTIRADIDYARGAALTTYGKVGVKVWIYKGEKFKS
mgnify:CR=1 FL=1